MAEKTDIRAVEMVRRIRDRQATELAGKSDEEIIEYFRKAGVIPVTKARAKRRPPNKGMQPPAREARRG